jgi:Ni/Co efflux regulator RcnB
MEHMMKSKSVVSAIVALSLATSGIAFAQGNRDNRERGRNEQAREQQDRRYNEGRQPNRPENRGRGYAERRDRDERGAGPDHRFYRGGRLPAEYRHRQYVVDDWRGHHLSAPPRGYHWVQTGADYVLVAITTGIILQLLLNR